jgi:hypothetical protein
MQQDIITSLIFLYNGYNDEVLSTIPTASFRKWLLSALCQFLAGSSLLVALFILMMQSTEVISLFLNFAALHFVSEIDNIGFSMAKFGFISDEVQAETKREMEFKVPNRVTSKVFRRVMLFLVACGLMVGYTYVVVSQRSGKFLPQSLRVQFSDDYQPYLPLFSGVYIQTKDDVVYGRVIYVERETELGMFGYCPSMRSWTFSIGDLDPCNQWLACSPETFSFDITSTSPSEWHVLSNTVTGEPGKTVVPIPSFTLASNDCYHNDGLCVDGQCIDNECECNDGKFGLRCEFDAPCPRIQIDFRTRPFPTDFGIIPYYFDILVDASDYPVEVYHRPVYVFESDCFFDIILSQGRRWVLTNSDLLNVTAPGSFFRPQNLPSISQLSTLAFTLRRLVTL